MTRIQSAIKQALQHMPESVQALSGGLQIEFINDRSAVLALAHREGCVLTEDFNYAQPMVVLDGSHLMAVVYCTPVNGLPMGVCKTLPVGTLPDFLMGVVNNRSLYAALDYANRAARCLGIAA